MPTWASRVAFGITGQERISRDASRGGPPTGTNNYFNCQPRPRVKHSGSRAKKGYLETPSVEDYQLLLIIILTVNLGLANSIRDHELRKVISGHLAWRTTNCYVWLEPIVFKVFTLRFLICFVIISMIRAFSLKQSGFNS